MSTFSWDRPKDRASADLHRHIDAARYRVAHEERRAAAVARLREAEVSSEVRGLVRALQMSAEADQQIGDHVGAAEQLDAAVATAKPLDSVQASAHLSRCALRIRVGDAEGARQDANLALRHAQVAESSIMASLAHTQSAVLHLAADDRHAALEELNLAFSLGREQNLTGPKGQALAVVGCVYEHEGRHDKAVEAWDRARLLHERSAASADLGRTYNNVGVVHYTQGRFTSAIPFFERALEILSEADDVVTILAILNNNVRAYELHYLDRAAEFRTEMDQFAALLSDPELPRFDDLGAVFAFSARRVPGVDSYASNLVVADPAMVLPAYRLPPG